MANSKDVVVTGDFGGGWRVAQVSLLRPGVLQTGEGDGEGDRPEMTLMEMQLFGFCFNAFPLGSLPECVGEKS